MKSPHNSDTCSLNRFKRQWLKMPKHHSRFETDCETQTRLARPPLPHPQNKKIKNRVTADRAATPQRDPFSAGKSWRRWSVASPPLFVARARKKFKMFEEGAAVPPSSSLAPADARGAGRGCIPAESFDKSDVGPSKRVLGSCHAPFRVRVASHGQGTR